MGIEIRDGTIHASKVIWADDKASPEGICNGNICGKVLIRAIFE